MKWFFFYDANFKPLRDNMVKSQHASEPNAFEMREDFLQDLGVMKNRAGGGVPTYLYKAQKIKDALEEIEPGEVCLFTDVDVQFMAPCRKIVEESIGDSVDLVLQREFDDIGVNIGFVAMRNTPGCRAFWEHVHAEIVRTQALDQRVVNNTLYSGMAEKEWQLKWARFPAEIWASSMAFFGPPPPNMAVHHANFTLERAPSRDPSLKLEQMEMVAQYVTGGDSSKVLQEFVEACKGNQSMLDYRDRHFGCRRPGPEWMTLPGGHPARPGGFRERKKCNQGSVADGTNTENSTN